MKAIFAVLVSLTAVTALWVISVPKMQDLPIPYADSAEGQSDSIRVTWFGVTTLLIDDGTTQILIDGFFSRPSLVDLALERPIEPDIKAIRETLSRFSIDRLKAVIPVHSHFDHAMDSAEVAKQTGAILMGSKSTAFIAAGSELDPQQIEIVDEGITYDLGAFKVRFVESKHAPLATNGPISGPVTAPLTLPAPYSAWKLGKAYSLIFDHPKARFLVQGSAGFIPGVLGDLTVDAVFLGTGGLSGLPSDYQDQYLDEFVHQRRAQTVFTIHHDNLTGNLGSVEQSWMYPEFDRTSAFDLMQRLLPSALKQMEFGVAVAL